jgi:hypothetical protein
MFGPALIRVLRYVPSWVPPYATKKRVARVITPFMLLVSQVTGSIISKAAWVQDHPSQPLTIVVRDGAGNPLQGIALDILLAGPPHEPYDNCVTGQTGQCTLVIPPGAYIIHFQRGWRGREFIPVEDQNAGALNDGGTGGFGIYLEPGDAEKIVTFVIGQDRGTGQLVPVWDMSRNPDMPPQPFAYDGRPLADPDDTLSGISLEPLSTTITGSVPQPDINATSTAQVLISEIDPGQSTAGEDESEAGVQPTLEPTTEQGHQSLPGNVLGLAMLGLLVLSIIVGGLALLLKRRGASGD